jgi:hypothetical protein
LSRRAALILLTLAGCLSLLAAMFYGDTDAVESDRLSAKQRIHAERIIELTRNEVSLRQERVDTLSALFKTIPRSETAARTRVDQEHMAAMEQWASTKRQLVELEKAVAADSAVEVQAILTRMKSK